MNLLMISGDRSVLQGKKGAFWYTLQELRKHWDRIDIICPRPPKRSSELCTAEGKVLSGDGGDIYFHPSPYPLLYQPGWIAKQGNVLAKQRTYEAITTHVFPPFYNSIGALMLKERTKIPCMFEVHHIDGWPKAASLREFIGRWLTRYLLPLQTRGADSVRVVNLAVFGQLKRWGIHPAKIHNLPSFYLDREALRVSDTFSQKYDIAFCARLVPNKGLREVLHALARIPSVSLVVIGDGPERTSLERLAKKLRIAERVTFLGWLNSQKEVMDAVQSAKIFVMNSSSEGGPRSALEAMACGMPVLSTRVGVMPEVIEDGVNGLFTDGSPDDLVERIQSLLADVSLRERLGTEATKILDRFDRSTLVKAYADALKAIRGSTVTSPSTTPNY